MSCILNPSVAQLVERLTVVVDTVLGILGNQLVTSSILVVRTLLLPHTYKHIHTFVIALVFVLSSMLLYRSHHNKSTLHTQAQSVLRSASPVRHREGVSSSFDVVTVVCAACCRSHMLCALASRSHIYLHLHDGDCWFGP